MQWLISHPQLTLQFGKAGPENHSQNQMTPITHAPVTISADAPVLCPRLDEKASCGASPVATSVAIPATDSRNTSAITLWRI
jgi:hypothetical protein